MHEHELDVFESSIIDGLRNRTLTTCSRWAARRRMLNDVVTGESKPYTDKYHPWVREMHDSWAPFNYAMKGAQLGVTEVAINRAFFTLDRMKKDVLYVLPTGKTAREFSKARFTTALAASPYISGMFTDLNSVDIKVAGSNTLYIRGSGGKDSLVSVPVSELILDEVDRMTQQQIELAYVRLDGQINKHVWGISTPTIPEYGIHKLYMGSTQEHFIFKCPSCSRLTELVWGDKARGVPGCMEICGEHATDSECKRSFLKCKECGAKLPHEDKPDWLATAYWESMDKDSNPDVRGFYINQLYSFTKQPYELVMDWFKGQGNEAAEIEFWNSHMGLPFIGSGARVDDEMIKRAVEKGGHSKKDPRPAGNRNRQRVITMGIDRGRWNHYVVKEWFFRQGIDLNAIAECKVLDEGKILDEDFDRRAAELMGEWQVLGCVVDADPYELESARFARRFPGYVWLCRYRKGPSGKQIVTSDDNDTPIVTVNRSYWLAAALGRFKTDPPRIALPRDISAEYQSHIKSLTSTYVRDEKTDEAKLIFVKQGEDDHFAHATTYAEIALPLCAARETNRDITNYR